MCPPSVRRWLLELPAVRGLIKLRDTRSCWPPCTVSSRAALDSAIQTSIRTPADLHLYLPPVTASRDPPPPPRPPPPSPVPIPEGVSNTGERRRHWSGNVRTRGRRPASGPIRSERAPLDRQKLAPGQLRCAMVARWPPGRSQRKSRPLLRRAQGSALRAEFPP